MQGRMKTVNVEVKAETRSRKEPNCGGVRTAAMTPVIAMKPQRSSTRNICVGTQEGGMGGRRGGGTRYCHGGAMAQHGCRKRARPLPSQCLTGCSGVGGAVAATQRAHHV